MKAIPTNEYGWIDYKKSILIIELNKNGNSAKFQVDGTSCLPRQVKGYVAESFKSSSKWFNHDWWYTKTTWGTKYPKALYFSEGKTAIEKADFLTAFSGSQTLWDETNEVADKYARPAEKILKAIMTEVYLKTGKEYAFDFDSFDYGINWYEAYIPLEYKNKKFLLTWNNCD
jgi:hypothetical protein